MLYLISILTTYQLETNDCDVTLNTKLGLNLLTDIKTPSKIGR